MFRPPLSPMMRAKSMSAFGFQMPHHQPTFGGGAVSGGTLLPGTAPTQGSGAMTARPGYGGGAVASPGMLPGSPPATRPASPVTTGEVLPVPGIIPGQAPTQGSGTMTARPGYGGGAMTAQPGGGQPRPGSSPYGSGNLANPGFYPGDAPQPGGSNLDTYDQLLHTQVPRQHAATIHAILKAIGGR